VKFPLNGSFFIGTHRILSSTPDEIQGTVTDKARQTFTDTLQGSLLLSTQGMAGRFARAAPHRLYRGPGAARASSGSWRALCVCPCGVPYCWCEIFKVQGLSPWPYC